MEKLSTSRKRDTPKNLQVSINGNTHIFQDAEFDFNKKEVKLVSESFDYLEYLPIQFQVKHKYKDGEVHVIAKIQHLQSLSALKKQATLAIAKTISF